MTIQDILNHFHIENEINAEAVAAIQNTTALRKQLIEFSRLNNNRAFAIALLDKFIALRKAPDGNMPVEDLMLACYNLGVQNEIEDCLKIWEAKNVDFDTHCGLDIQLVLFAGIENTIDFLEQQESFEAWEALEYINVCNTAGDFDDLETYFSLSTLHWFL